MKAKSNKVSRRCPALCSCELFFLVFLRWSAAITAISLPLHLGVVANLRRRGDFLTTAHQKVVVRVVFLTPLSAIRVLFLTSQ